MAVKKKEAAQCSLSMPYYGYAYTKAASMVILVFSSLEIGQFASASFANSANFSASRPGTLAFTSRWLSTIAPFSKVMVHLVSMLPGVRPAPEMMKLSFMVKQPAWAAAISSSGLVPAPSSKRLLKEYGVLLRAPAWEVSVPLPSLPVPCQLADANLFMFDILLFAVKIAV